MAIALSRDVAVAVATDAAVAWSGSGRRRCAGTRHAGGAATCLRAGTVARWRTMTVTLTAMAGRTGAALTAVAGVSGATVLRRARLDTRTVGRSPLASIGFHRRAAILGIGSLAVARPRSVAALASLGPDTGGAVGRARRRIRRVDVGCALTRHRSGGVACIGGRAGPGRNRPLAATGGRRASTTTGQQPGRAALKRRRTRRWGLIASDVGRVNRSASHTTCWDTGHGEHLSTETILRISGYLWRHATGTGDYPARSDDTQHGA